MSLAGSALEPADPGCPWPGIGHDPFVIGAGNDAVLRRQQWHLPGTFASGGGLTIPGAWCSGPTATPLVVGQGNAAVLQYDGSTGAFVKTFASGGGAAPLVRFPNGDLLSRSGNAGCCSTTAAPALVKTSPAAVCASHRPGVRAQRRPSSATRCSIRCCSTTVAPPPSSRPRQRQRER